MTSLKHTPAEAILVAIHVSRQRNDVLIEMAGSSRHHRPCRHQNRFRLSALLRRTDAKRKNLSQQVP
jgi:hypothetical protein